MRQAKIYELIILGLWLIIIAILFTKSEKLEKQLPEKDTSGLAFNKKYYISRVVVLKGDLFDFTLESSNSRILCKIALKTTEETKDRVISLFKDSENPYVILLDKSSEGYNSNVFLTVNSVEINLKDWILSNNLAFK